MTTRPDRVRVTGLVGCVTGSTELGILGLCSGNGGVLELLSWLALWLVEESAVSYWFVAHLAGLNWTKWCHAGELDFDDICGHQLQLCSCAGLHCLQ